jgi:hypothetical protein
MKKILLGLTTVIIFAGICSAEATFKLSLWEKKALPSDDVVNGIEFGLGSDTSKVKGLAWNFIYGRTKNVIGAQVAIVNWSNAFIGVEWGAANFNAGHISGAQVGFFNKSKSVKGIQLGVVNMTEDIEGVQIGFANFIKNSSLPFMVIVNARF